MCVNQDKNRKDPFKGIGMQQGCARSSTTLHTKPASKLDEHLFQGAVGDAPVQDGHARLGLLHGRKNTGQGDLMGGQLVPLRPAQTVGLPG